MRYRNLHERQCCADGPIRRRMVGTAATLLLAIAAATGRAQEQLPEGAAERVVRVFGQESPEADRYRAGVGYLLTPTDVLTAFHVVQGCELADILTPDGARILVESVLLVDPARDIAVVRLRSPVNGVGAFDIQTGSLEGSSLKSVFVPQLTEGDTGFGVTGGSRRCSMITIVDIRYFVVDGPATPGESGMPWFDAYGHPVAVFVAGDSERSFAVVPDMQDPATFEAQPLPCAALSAPERPEGPAQIYAQLAALEAQLCGFQFAAARRTVNDLRAGNPGDWLALYACAEACLTMSDPAGAAGILDDMARLAQDDAVASELRMVAYAEMGCHDEAWSQMSLAIASFGGSMQRIRRLAECGYELESWSVADTWSEAWLALEPWNPDAQVLRAKVLFREDRFDESAELLEEAIPQFVRNDELCALLAACYGAMEASALAADWYQKAALYNPAEDEYQYRSGYWLHRAGRLAESLECYRRLYSGRTTDAQVPAAIMGAAMVYVEMGEGEAAVTLLEHHLELLAVSDLGRDVVAWVVTETEAEGAMRSVVLEWAHEGKLTDERAVEVRDVFE